MIDIEDYAEGLAVTPAPQGDNLFVILLRIISALFVIALMIVGYLFGAYLFNNA